MHNVGLFCSFHYDVSPWESCRSLEITRITGTDGQIGSGDLNSDNKNPTMVCLILATCISVGALCLLEFDLRWKQPNECSWYGNIDLRFLVGFFVLGGERH